MNQVVILAGGLGSRMGSEYADIPKCLIRIGEKTILEHQIHFFSEFGIKSFHLALGKHSDRIIDFVATIENFREFKFSFTCEKSPLGTGGALIFSLPFLHEEFLLIHGDIFIDANINDLLSSVEDKDVDFVQLLHPSNHMKDSDVVICDEEGRIVRYSPKPRGSFEGVRNMCNAGVYALKKHIFAQTTFAERMDLDRELLPRLVQNGARALGVRNLGFVRDAGTPERLMNVRNLYLQGKISRRKSRLVMFDRDGTINKSRGHLSDYSKIQLCDGVAEAISWFNSNGYYVAVVTNQPVIARGEASTKEVEAIHAYLDYLLAEKGAFIDHYFVCPHHPDSGYHGEVKDLKIICKCRKPEIGLAMKALEYFGIDRKHSIIIGDSWRDQKLSENLDVDFYLVSEQNSLNAFKEIVANVKNENSQKD